MSTIKDVLVPTTTCHWSYFAPVKADSHFVGHFWFCCSGRLCYCAAQVKSWEENKKEKILSFAKELYHNRQPHVAQSELILTITYALPSCKIVMHERQVIATNCTLLSPDQRGFSMKGASSWMAKFCIIWKIQNEPKPNKLPYTKWTLSLLLNSKQVQNKFALHVTHSRLSYRAILDMFTQKQAPIH